jgi:hypothetical protein
MLLKVKQENNIESSFNMGPVCFDWIINAAETVFCLNRYAS